MIETADDARRVVEVEHPKILEEKQKFEKKALEIVVDRFLSRIEESSKRGIYFMTQIGVKALTKVKLPPSLQKETREENYYVSIDDVAEELRKKGFRVEVKFRGHVVHVNWMRYLTENPQNDKSLEEKVGKNENVNKK